MTVVVRFMALRLAFLMVMSSPEVDSWSRVFIWLSVGLLGVRILKSDLHVNVAWRHGLGIPAQIRGQVIQMTKVLIFAIFLFVAWHALDSDRWPSLGWVCWVPRWLRQTVRVILIIIVEILILIWLVNWLQILFHVQITDDLFFLSFFDPGLWSMRHSLRYSWSCRMTQVSHFCRPWCANIPLRDVLLFRVFLRLGWYFDCFKHLVLSLISSHISIELLIYNLWPTILLWLPIWLLHLLNQFYRIECI